MNRNCSRIDEDDTVGPEALSSRELVDYILVRYHRYFRLELPRIIQLVSADPRLYEVVCITRELATELLGHRGQPGLLDRKERVLYPALLEPRISRDPGAAESRQELKRTRATTSVIVVRLQDAIDRFPGPEQTRPGQTRKGDPLGVAASALRELTRDLHAYMRLEAVRLVTCTD